MKNSPSTRWLVMGLAGFALAAAGTARAADPVITSPLTTTIGVVSGGDSGEGLDLEGTFPYALSIGADTEFSAKIRDATFKGLIDNEVAGATLVAGNRILNWYVVDYGDSANDDSLEAATSSIRWSQAGSGVPAITLTLENLEVGVQYKFQMMFGEECCNRGFDILFDDQLVVKDLNPGNIHGGISAGAQEALVTHTYAPKTSTIVLRFDGNESSGDYSDHNAIFNAITVEKLGVALDTDKDGMPDAYEIQYGFNPNDATDGPKDFDGDGVSNAGEYTAGTDPKDVTKPTVVATASTGSFNTVTIAFSEELEVATATVAANYTFSPALAVTSATYAKKTVTLTTAAQTPGGIAYSVAIKGVKDTSKNEVAAGTTAKFYSYLMSRTGVLKFSYWGGITGTPVDNLYSDPRYPASPDLVGAVFSFNSRDFFPNDSHENYGATMEGYLTPSESGSYRFFIYSDDASQFFLSNDDKEAGLAQIAEEAGCCNFFTEPDSARTSEPVALAAGKKYFVRHVYKEGGGGDYGQIAWRKEGSTTSAAALRPIPGEFLSSAVDLPGPAEGAFTTRVPAPNAKSISPATHVTIAHRDGKVAWTQANVSLKVDGAAVTPTFTKAGTVLTLDYVPAALLASESVHTVSLSYPDPSGAPATLDWSFTVQKFSGPTRDKVGSYPAILAGSAVFTADKGGATGKDGDFGINLTTKGGPVVSFDSKFLTAASAATGANEVSVAFWQKKLDVSDSSAFTLNSPSTPYARGFHAHVPWSNQHIYFDTVGCCDGTTQRIEAGIDTFAGYSGDATWWTSQWHFFAFTKKGNAKNIWVDGQLFLSGENTAPLPSDLNAFYMGSGGNGAELSHAIIDNFSVYSKELTEANVLALSKGTLPTALPAAASLIAYWDYNDPPAESVKVKAVRDGTKVNITSEPAVLPAGWVLQTAPSVTGPWATQAGATTPITVNIGAGNAFLRAAKP